MRFRLAGSAVGVGSWDSYFGTSLSAIWAEILQVQKPQRSQGLNKTKSLTAIQQEVLTRTATRRQRLDPERKTQAPGLARSASTGWLVFRRTHSNSMIATFYPETRYSPDEERPLVI